MHKSIALQCHGGAWIPEHPTAAKDGRFANLEQGNLARKVTRTRLSTDEGSGWPTERMPESSLTVVRQNETGGSFRCWRRAIRLSRDTEDFSESEPKFEFVPCKSEDPRDLHH